MTIFVMMMKKFYIFVLAMAFFALNASGQSITIKQNGESFKGSASRIEREKMIGTKMDPKNLPVVDNNRFSDDKLKELEKQMREREWGSEDTAWERALVQDNKEGYNKYIAMYPRGAHRADAEKRLVDLEVEDVFRGAHDRMPGMKCVEEDIDSPTTTVEIKNNTGYSLTVYYSGNDSKSIIISAGSKGSITVPNGDYKIAASVPVKSIHPFAGSEYLGGGRYEVAFYVVSTRY